MTQNHLSLPVVDANALPWVQIKPGFSFKLLRATGDDDTWTELLRLEPGTLVSRHRHTGEAHVYTLSGQRKLLETGELIGPGGYVYERPGSTDSWMAVGDEPLLVMATVRGAIEYVDEHGQVISRSTPTTAAEGYLRGCANP